MDNAAETPLLRPAQPAEAEALTALVLRSKAHWGYDEAFMAVCRDELTLRPEQLVPGRTLVAEQDGTALGFGLLAGDAPVGELAMLFVEPAAIGQGLGGRLYRGLLELARTAGFTRLTIDADPCAADFYAAHGAVRTGETPSGSIPGRTLPVFTVTVPQTPDAPISEPAA
ncbi:GNAT family N-acetyltransferase [Kitasatospora acidiphila]|uniref:GNAT family N-acetyltransferase n=1 Tax=Kitasatospora acidiphila TaxID=2567942 RepID=A0A540W2B0_9ACTN|nr:GNAT family N-acetyltransferase [Kitasatospora acidiphila]TQF03145.1 GNAT family N-acetyltransferase [Kitasatospora acidiphila]